MDDRSVRANSNNIFHILVVNDDPAAAGVLREVMKNLQHLHELHFVLDGSDALDFLHRTGGYRDVPFPDLILLDVNMPRLGGLDTLSAIKNDPQLRVIPVIMLSTSRSPNDVRKSYMAHANGYVQKPTSLDSTVKLVEAIESFWMNFALFPTREERPQQLRQQDDSKGGTPGSSALASTPAHTGKPIAPGSVEASSTMRNDRSSGTAVISARKSGCEEHNRLLDEFGMAVRELIDLHEQQFVAIVEDDAECHRFDLLIHMANEKKQLAKYGYLRHVEEHGCSNFDAFNNVRA